MVEFLALIAHVAQAKSIFEWRDTSKQGIIQITYDQLLEISSEF